MTQEREDTRRPLWLDTIILTLALGIMVAMIGLGNWQLQRLAWKLDLIDAVESRAYAAPVPAPLGPVTGDGDAYRRVTATGVFDYAETRSVKAVTDLGLGNWLLTPLATEGGIFWVNRGFIPQNFQGTLQEPLGQVTITGLLRLTEPHGTLLERNRPEAGRWVSRDVGALSDTAGIDAADYFIDADHLTAPGTWPRGGLTILTFRNTHLSYALTWYAMALLFFAAMAWVIWDRLRQGRRSPRLVHSAD